MLVEIWSDVICPWCYIGKRRFERALASFPHADQVDLEWRSYELDPHAPARRSRTYAEAVARKYGMTVDDATERLEHMNRMAAGEGLVYDLARTQGGNTFDAHRVIHLGSSKGRSVGANLEEAFFRAYFTDLLPIGEPDVVRAVAVEAGLDDEEVSDVLATDRFAAEVRRDEAEAAELGCSGVPFFVIDRRWAVPGAQDTETFTAVLNRMWERRSEI